MEKLYSHKSKKKEETDTVESSPANEQDSKSEGYDQLTFDDAVNDQRGTE